MKNKTIYYTLIGLAGLLLFPSLTNATLVMPQNSKKEVDGEIYTAVYKRYELEGFESSDEYAISGLTSENKMIIASWKDLPNEYFVFENGIYRDSKATIAEVFDSRKTEWRFGPEEYYLDDYTDDKGNEKVGIFYENHDFRDTLADEYCYVMSTDITPVEGRDYYTFSNIDNTPELVSSFDPDLVTEYYLRNDCADYKNILIKTLTDEEAELITSLEEEHTTEYADNNTLFVQTKIVKRKDDYVIISSIHYKEEEASPYVHINRIYDFSGKKLAEVEGTCDFHYLKKSNLFFALSNEHFIVYDLNFNIIYNELKSKLPILNQDLDTYYLAAADFDSDVVYFDFSGGYYLVLTRYVVEEGNNQSFLGKDLIIKFNGDLNLLDKLTVNDNVLDSKNYTKTKGSTIITLSKEYLSTLKDGTYTLKASYTDGGEASSTFIIDKDLINPSTSDNVINTILVAGISFIGFIGAQLYFKKRRLIKG